VILIRRFRGAGSAVFCKEQGAEHRRVAYPGRKDHDHRERNRLQGLAQSCGSYAGDEVSQGQAQDRRRNHPRQRRPAKLMRTMPC